MTFKEMSGALQTAWVKNIGWKVPLVIVSLLVIFVVWESPPPSFVAYSQLSASQIQSFLGRNGNAEFAPAKTSSDSTPGYVPTVHTDSPGADDGPKTEPKKRPVEIVEPDPNSKPPVNTTTVAEAPTSAINATSDVFVEEDTQLVPFNTTADSETPTNAINATSDVFVEEDSQLVDLSTMKDDPQQLSAEEKKYIVPLLSGQVGTGNQLMEYKSAAVVARTLNRTLCLVPFFGGPGRHFGIAKDVSVTPTPVLRRVIRSGLGWAGYLGDKHEGLVMEDRYDIEVLSKFVKVAHMDECMQQCNYKIDVHWRLRNSRPPRWQQWFNDTPQRSIDFTRQYSTWGSTADVERDMGPLNDVAGHCVGLGGLFPGLRWRGVSIAASTYMVHSQKVKKAADLLQARSLPGSNDNNFISIHWRFEESRCSGHPLGLCFSRCTDGAVISNGRRSETWETMTRENATEHRTKAGFNGMALTMEDISGAISDRAEEWGTKNVYLATDGWLRGEESQGILKWVVEDIRSKGLNVAGLWMVGGLPNFADDYYVGSDNMAEVFGLDPNEKVSNHLIALVEQELCERSAVFLGSGQSTWSLAVSETRRGRRCKNDLTEAVSGMNLGTTPEVMEQAIINKILTAQYVAGPTCRGAGFKATMEKYEDEEPDGWLDYDACEVRLLNGKGNCKRITGKM